MANDIITVFKFAGCENYTNEYEIKIAQRFEGMGLNKNYRWFTFERLMRFSKEQLMHIMVETVEAIY